MSPIQIILISASIFIVLYIYSRFRSSLLDAILIFLFFAGTVFFVLFPEVTTIIAHWLGVSRGINLAFYFTIFFFLFLILKLYARIRQLEQKFTNFVSEKAIDSAEYLKNKNESKKN